MKILMLGWELPPYNAGGLGVVCYQLCQALARRGADIEFIVPYTTEHDISFMRVTPASPQGVREIVSSGIAYDSYKYVFGDGHEERVDIFGQQAMYETAVAELVAERAQEFSVIHAHDWLTFRAALRVREESGKPLILHVHSIERDRAGGELGNPLVREIEATAFALADRIIAVSEYTRRMIAADYDIPLEKIAVVHNSIDAADVAPLDSQNAYAYLSAMKRKGYKVVVNVGRLTVQKGLPHLLHAAHEVIARAPKTLFLIVGSGEQYAELVRLSAELGLSQHVIFVEFQRGKRWRDAFAIGDLFVMPSISEPFGLTALEAIGFGAPVLISRQSGVAELIKNSLQVDFWDTASMANQIVAIVQNPSLQHELYLNSRREFDRLTWDDSARTLLNVFEKHALPKRRVAASLAEAHR